MAFNVPMSSAEFQTLAVKASEQYLEYLKTSKNLAGCSVNKVIGIKPYPVPHCYAFTLEDRVNPSAQYVIYFRGKEESGLTIIKAIGPTGRARAVQVSDESGLLDSFPEIHPNDFVLVSDLRFLIENLHTFYGKHLLSFSPPPPVQLPELPENLTAPFSDEQRSAYATVFSSSFSYIHGAPGTGKTNMVLSRCILRYIQANKRVFLLAPTNNALEQMLRGILPTFRSLNLDLHTVYRLGMSSHEFAEDFPEVVGDPNTDALLADLREQEAIAAAKLAQYQQIRDSHTAAAEKLHYKAVQYELFGNRILALLSALNAAGITLSEEEEKAKQLQQAISHIHAQASLLNQEIESIQAMYTADSGRLSELERSYNSLFSILWSQHKKASVFSSIQDLRQSIAQEKENLDALHKKRGEATADLPFLLSQTTQISASITRLKQSIQNATDKLYALSESCPIFREHIQFSLSKHDYTASAYLDIISSTQAAYQDMLSAAPVLDTASLESELAEIRGKISDLGNTARQIQHKTALVLAGTVDSSLRELDSPGTKESVLPVSHVFLDEAGYTSIARGAVAFSLDVPVTFLGDHHQLPPICEKNKIQKDEPELCLWACSAAYLPDLLYHGVEYLYWRCLEKGGMFSAPSFQNAAFAELTKSYRFGHALAQVLGKHIYGPNFQGLSPHPFEITVIDCPCIDSLTDRFSRSEASAITEYVHNLPDASFAVLAPYKKQVNLLRDMLPSNLRDSIMTVHRSQGREWDTVFLSVVDTKKPYFTNSCLPVGKSVLCTAISRAKKRLVLVCDISAWRNKRNQMITHLIHCGKSIDLNDHFPFRT